MEIKSPPSPTRPRRTVYMDGVWDLFHAGHVRAVQQCVELGDRVVIGVMGDPAAEDYKRRPIISEADRATVVGAIRGVDQVICPCPLAVTDEFMDAYGIDLVVHCFADRADLERQKAFFEAPIRRGAFKTLDYHRGISTTDIIRRVMTSWQPQ